MSGSAEDATLSRALVSPLFLPPSHLRPFPLLAWPPLPHAVHQGGGTIVIIVAAGQVDDVVVGGGRARVGAAQRERHLRE